METQKDYKPSCDFDSLEIFGHESKCSIAFASDYGKGLFGWFKAGSIPALNSVVPMKYQDILAETKNGFLGCVNYAVLFVLGLLSSRCAVRTRYIMSLVSLIPTFWLAYVLMFILNDFCIVCVSTYFCNFALIYLNRRMLKSFDNKQKSD